MKYGEKTSLRVIAATSQEWCCQVAIARSEAIERGDTDAAERLLGVAAKCGVLAETTRKALEDMNESRTHDNQ